MPADPVRLPASMGLSWQVARWARVVPGRLGVLALLAIPILFFLPLHGNLFFESWRQGSVAVLSLGALAFALALGRDSATPQPSEFWVYQKGLSLADWGLTRWMLDAALASAVFAVWLAVWCVAASVAGEAVTARVIMALLIWMLSLQLIVAALLFALGAAGTSRGAEVCVLLVMLALLQPVLALALPPWAGTLTEVLLPPLVAAVDLRSGILSGATARSLLPSLLQVGAYLTVMLTAGTMLLARRRPEEGA